MRIQLILLIFILSSVQISAKPNGDKPKLVVGIVIDQMRADYLYQFESKFGNDGFNQLKGAGTHFRNCYINYLPSYTGPGHATIYTGSVPAIHGIAGNGWYDKKNSRSEYCVRDRSVMAVGGSPNDGFISPRNLWVTTITDQLKLAQQSKSKTIAISLKDRGAALPGGHTADAAYWMDDSLGHFMTSTFYLKQLPDWVSAFNKAEIARAYLDKKWDAINVKNSYQYAQNENLKYVGNFANQDSPLFPFSFAEQKAAYIKKTPYGNDIIFDFAKLALLSENMGQGEYTDFLALSFSATDYIGHAFGPHSMEIEDAYIRFDKALGSFVSHLDRTYGKGNYLLFLTSDHGAAYNPSYLMDRNIPAGYVFEDSLKSDLNTYLKMKTGIDSAVFSMGNNQVYFRANLDEANKDIASFNTVDFLNNRDEIHFCTEAPMLSIAVMPHLLKEYLINSYNRERSGDVLYLMKPAYLDAYSITGTSHGTWAPYDTKIPLIFYGWHIPKNKNIYSHVYMTDIAPTLASLLNITPPNGSIGNALLPFNEK
jgi:predicted AlkP superfamily pyrophosphatase or phosphodiesterase